MATKITFCSHCGNKITNGVVYHHEGKPLCYDCYQVVQQELISLESRKQQVYNYLKQLFSLLELPNDVLLNLEKEVSKGKTYEGAQFTLYYYYEVLEKPRGNINIIPFVIRDQYENAQEYKKKTEELKSINAKIDLSQTAPRKVILKKSDLEKNNTHKRKLNNIADL